MEKPFFFACALSCLLLSPQSSADEIAKHLTTIVEPKPLDRVMPKYPIQAAREGRSGWSKFSFVIEKDGSVSNIIELESSGSSDFSKEAKKALKQWKYQPAMENGEPIQQCVNSVQLDFRMGNGHEDGVRRKFKKRYLMALDAIKAKDYPLTEELIEKMTKMKFRYMNENNLLRTISATYAEAIGDKEQQLSHLMNIRFASDNKATKEYELATLNSRFKLAVELNKFQMAYDTYSRLKELDIAAPYLPSYEKVIQQIDRYIGGEQALQVAGDIKENDYWHYSLLRNEFSVTDIQGALYKLDVRCANKRHVYTVESNNTWKLPSSWQNCSLFVYGDNNTTFTLVEHPLKS